MSDIFKIKTHVFEGPLDLLLGLIEKRKLFINDIALAKVADDFINHIKQFDRFPMEDSANFILIASTLLLIKSKSLLPSLSLTEEEEEGIHDLETRLKIYKKIKDASLQVKEMLGNNVIYFPNQDRPRIAVFSPHSSMTVANIFRSMSDLLHNLPKKEQIPKAIVRKVISLEDMITTLTHRITTSLRTSFREFTSVHREERVNIIVSFLAMLELVKQGIIHVEQGSAFGDIHMEPEKMGVPKYN